MTGMERGDGRNEVRALTGVMDAEALGAHIKGMVGNTRSADLDTLKIAEYALLVGPMTDGATQYLDTLEIQAGTKNPLELIDDTGNAIAGFVLNAVSEDPNRKLIKKISSARSRRVAYGDKINGIDTTVRAAAGASASTMYSSVIANAAVIHKAGDPSLDTHAQFLEAVRRSTQLPLARPLVHLEQLEGSIQALDELAVSHLLGGESHNLPNLAYDWDRKRTALKEQFDNWIIGVPVRTLGELSLCDVQIGCPISFSPKLVLRYYRTFCDLIEANNGWPGNFYATTKPLPKN